MLQGIAGVRKKWIQEGKTMEKETKTDKNGYAVNEEFGTVKIANDVVASQLPQVHDLCDHFHPNLIPSSQLSRSFLYLDVQWGMFLANSA